MPKAPCIAGIVLALLSAAAPAFGQRQQQISEAIAGAARADGNVLVDGIRFSDLEDADETEIVFEVERGKRYVIYGACDRNCAELRLSAKDDSGETIDYAYGERPKIEIEDFTGDKIRLEVFMMDCKVDPCEVGVSLGELPGQTRVALGVPLSKEEKDKLLNVYNMRVPNEWRRVGDLVFGRLGNRDVTTISLEVDGANTYRVQADCGQVCGDINVTVLSAGALVGSDIASDRIPEVEIGPDAFARGKRKLDVDVKMESCLSGTCPFVLGVYKTN